MATWGKMTSRIIIMDADPVEAFRKADDLVKIINSNGFEAHIEDINAAEAFIGAIPDIPGTMPKRRVERVLRCR